MFMNKPCHVPHALQITFWGTVFIETFLFLAIRYLGSESCFLKSVWQSVQKSEENEKERKNKPGQLKRLHDELTPII